MVLPDSVTDIACDAFYNCNSLKKLTIFGCTVNAATRWDVKKMSVQNVKYMVDNRDYSVRMSTNVKRMFAA